MVGKPSQAWLGRISVVAGLLALAACSSTPETDTLADSRDFRERLGWFESRGDYQIVNRFGYLGKYQMGECALIDTGHYLGDASGCLKQDWAGPWSGLNGVYSLADYLNSPQAQDAAVQALIDQNWYEIRRRGLDIYVGRQMYNDVNVTVAGMLAAAHLGGVGGVERFLGSGGTDDPADAFGTSLSTYMARFEDALPPVGGSGYEVMQAYAEARPQSNDHGRLSVFDHEAAMELK